MFMNILLGILSEVILSVGIIFIILLDIFLNDSNSKKFISRVSLSVLLLSILSVVCNINYYLKEQFFLNSNKILNQSSLQLANSSMILSKCPYVYLFFSITSICF